MSDPAGAGRDTRALTERSRRFYESFPFPGKRPIDRDGLIFLRWFERAMQRRTSARDAKAVRVFDAGCGTGNTSLALAARFPEAVFIGLDQSHASLAAATREAERRALGNVTFRLWNLMMPLVEEETYDLVVCLGVLHHTADMLRVLRNLRAALRPDGELALWVYARHGRYRHTLNVRLLQMLLGPEPAADEAMRCAREFVRGEEAIDPLADLVGGEASTAYTDAADDPVWIADQFLNPVEAVVDMEELLALCASASLRVTRVLGWKEDGSTYFRSPVLRERFRALPLERQYVALDLLLKPERHFVVLAR